jgi:Domain of Unknown Function with PDB structure (DUF3857)
LFYCLPRPLGQTPTKPPAADNFQKEALVFERTETAIRMHSDGTGERSSHFWIRLQSEGAARQFGVLSFSYAAANETPHITLVRVHKQDGSTIDTPVADAIEMPAAVTPRGPSLHRLGRVFAPVIAKRASAEIASAMFPGRWNRQTSPPDARTELWEECMPDPGCPGTERLGA